MPSFRTHCAISKKRTGNDFAELHKWIDTPRALIRLGSDHRIKRHNFNEEDKNTIKRHWDKKGYQDGLKARPSGPYVRCVECGSENVVSKGSMWLCREPDCGRWFTKNPRTKLSIK